MRIVDEDVFLNPGTYKMEWEQRVREGDVIEFCRIWVKDVDDAEASIVIVRVVDFCEWLDAVAPFCCVSFRVTNQYESHCWFLTKDGPSRWGTVPTSVEWCGMTGELEVFRPTYSMPILRD